MHKKLFLRFYLILSVCIFSVKVIIFKINKAYKKIKINKLNPCLNYCILFIVT